MIKSTSPVNIEEVYNDYLDSEQERNRLERYEGNESWYHGSGAGSCSRKLYFESIEQAKPTNPIETKSKRVLRLGSVLHDDFEKAFKYYNTSNSTSTSTSNKKENKIKEKEYEFHFEQEIRIDELNVRGFYDMVAVVRDNGVYLYDLKTSASYSWKLKFGRNRGSFTPSIHYELQLGTYGYAVQEKFGSLEGMYLLYYNKDNSQLREVEVPLPFVSRAYLFWRNINDEHKQGLPMFREGVSPVQKWQCKYCQFLDHCNPPNINETKR